MAPYYIPSSNPDRDEDGIPCTNTAGHDCLDHVVYHSANSTEPHGESFQDEWYTCSVCAEKYTVADLDAMYNPVLPAVQPITAKCVRAELSRLDQEVA